MSTEIMYPLFEPFTKIARLSRDIVITEKIDGTNAQVYITEDGQVFAGSRNRWLTAGADNFGFYQWVDTNKELLVKGLGAGRHFGEWWGNGIQRTYGRPIKTFSLFNVHRYGFLNNPGLPEDHPLRAAGVSVVPVLYRGPFETEAIEKVLDTLRKCGSVAQPGFMDPEGIVVFHEASQELFKKTLKNDETPKSKVKI